MLLPIHIEARIQQNLTALRLDGILVLLHQRVELH